MTIKQIFDHISSDGGSNAKMEILNVYKGNPTLKKVLYLANSGRVKFYIKQIPGYNRLTNTVSLEDALDLLTPLQTREKTGHEAVAHLKGILQCLSSDDAYIIERIIERDCKIGMGTTNINKIFPNLIEDTPYMGAKAFSKKLVEALLAKGKGAYSQMKMDGRYTNGIINKGIVFLESRQGETCHLDGAPFIKDLERFPDCVLNGELTMDGYTRYVSNGIIASLISIIGKRKKGEDVTKENFAFVEEHLMTTEEALAKIRYTAWDMISLLEYDAAKSSTPYNQRLSMLTGIIETHKTEMVSIIEMVFIQTYQEAMNHFQKTINLGHEGTILKAIDGAWKDGKPTWQIKLKLEIHIDLEIIGFRYGTGKNKHVISTVEAKSSDGLLVTAPTGIDEKTMRWITDNQANLLGKILEVKCSGVSQNEKGEYSTMHPVYGEIRTDKIVADTLAQILDIEAMAKGLK